MPTVRRKLRSPRKLLLARTPNLKKRRCRLKQAPNQKSSLTQTTIQTKAIFLKWRKSQEDALPSPTVYPQEKP